MEVSIVPVLLGGGVPLVPELSKRIGLTLTEQRVFKKTGTVSLVYEVNKPDHHEQSRNRPPHPTADHRLSAPEGHPVVCPGATC